MNRVDEREIKMLELVWGLLTLPFVLLGVVLSVVFAVLGAVLGIVIELIVAIVGALLPLAVVAVAIFLLVKFLDSRKPAYPQR